MEVSIKDSKLVASIEPDEEGAIRKAGGNNGIGDNVLPLEAYVFHSGVGVNTHNYHKDQVNLTIHILRRTDGSLRPRVESAEPTFHKDAYYLLKFMGPSRTEDKYYQFDKNGRLLKSK